MKISLAERFLPHSHGRVLGARIDILPFFFLKSRRSLTRRKIHVRFSLRDIVRHAPKKIKSQQSFTRERFYRDARIRLQLAEVTYMLRLRASDSRQIESAKESLSHWFTYTVRDSFKARLAGFEFAKTNCCKSTSNAPLVSFAFKTITLRNFEKKMREANASVKRNTLNTIKQIISLKLPMKMLGHRWSRKRGVLLVQNV